MCVYISICLVYTVHALRISSTSCEVVSSLQPELVDCGGLPSPDNGRVILSGTEFGSSATYFCDADLLLVGESVRFCQENGSWSGEQPSCGKAIHAVQYTNSNIH